MSTIDGLGSGNSTGLKTASTGSNKLGKNEFLKLLTTQLANQDPLAPTDNQAFIAQLAQFASVEAADATNSRLDALIVAQAANNQTAVANLVGKDIVYKTDHVTLGATGGSNISGQVSADATIANAIITDSNGKKIRTLSLNDVKAGTMTFAWDGKDDNGNPVAPGDYQVKITAADKDNQNVPCTLQGRARATGVTFESGIPELVLNGQRVKLADVIQIAEGTTTNASSSTQSALDTINLIHALNRS